MTTLCTATEEPRLPIGLSGDLRPSMVRYYRATTGPTKCVVVDSGGILWPLMCFLKLCGLVIRRKGGAMISLNKVFDECEAAGVSLTLEKGDLRVAGMEKLPPDVRVFFAEHWSEIEKALIWHDIQQRQEEERLSVDLAEHAERKKLGGPGACAATCGATGN